MRRLVLFVCVIMCVNSLGVAESFGLPVTQVIVDSHISVFFISDEFLTDVQFSEQQHSQNIVELDQILSILTSCLSQDEMKTFLQDYEDTGHVQREVLIPSMETLQNNELGTWISERKVGDFWVFAYHSLVPQSNLFTTMSITNFLLQYEDGVLKRTYNGNVEKPILCEEHIQRVDNMEILVQEDGTILAIFENDNCAVAVLCTDSIAPDQVLNLELNGATLSQVVGVEQADGAVLVVCPLEKVEVEQLRAGTQLILSEGIL